MGRRPSEQPEAFALAVAAEVRKEMGARRLSGRALGRLIDRSESYIRDRVADRLEFSLNDIERFCDEIGISPEDFIARVDSALGTHDVVRLEDAPDVTINMEGVKNTYGLAAKKGRRKADELPHAE